MLSIRCLQQKLRAPFNVIVILVTILFFLNRSFFSSLFFPQIFCVKANQWMIGKCEISLLHQCNYEFHTHQPWSSFVCFVWHSLVGVFVGKDYVFMIFHMRFAFVFLENFLEFFFATFQLFDCRYNFRYKSFYFSRSWSAVWSIDLLLTKQIEMERNHCFHNK